MRDLPPFRADHVGSLLRPPELLRARAERAAGRIDDASLRAALQEVGLRAATDGEFRCTSWHMDFDEAAKHVPPDQLCRSPQRGFSATAEGSALTVDEQVAKLRLVVEIAADGWA